MVQAAPFTTITAFCRKCITKEPCGLPSPKTAFFALRAVGCLCGYFSPFVPSHTTDYATLASALLGFFLVFSWSITRWQNPSDSRYSLAHSAEQKALVRLPNRTLRLFPHVSQTSRLLVGTAVLLCSLGLYVAALFVQSCTRHRVDESFSLCVSVDQCRLPCLVQLDGIGRPLGHIRAIAVPDACDFALDRVDAYLLRFKHLLALFICLVWCRGATDHCHCNDQHCHPLILLNVFHLQ